jgi:plasmid stabilization system protein ParE
LTFEVRLSVRAHRDLQRLPAFLSLKSEIAAQKARSTLAEALESLREFPTRGRDVGGGVRELAIAFGRDAYLIRYLILEREVIVTRLLHSREQR